MKIVAELWRNLKNPLYRNSIFIALGRVTDVGFGFFFWTVAARLYSVADVGIATALVSSLGLVISFSRFGFDISIIRFMPSKDRGMVFNTTFWVTGITTPVISILYLLLLDFISPELVFLRDYALLFVIFALVTSITLITGNALLSLRRADLRWLQHLILGGRILLLFPFVILGSFGIFASLGVIYLIAAIVTILFIYQYISLRFEINRIYLRDTFHFLSHNYVASLLQVVPLLILPILVLNLAGSSDAALFYIAFTIGNLVLIIPDAMTTSFFIEGSHGINMRKAAMHTVSATYAILIPTILFIFFFGDRLLGLFGAQYLAAFDLLKLIAISALFLTIYNLFIPIQNIRLQVEAIVLVNVIRCVLLLGLSYILLIQYGLMGAGFAWLVTHFGISIVIVIFGKWKRWI